MNETYAKDAKGFASIPILKSVLNNDLDTVTQLTTADESLINFVHKKSGDSVLLVAARYKCVEILQHLMQNGADVEHRNLDGKRALHEAAGSGCVQCARLLITEGGRVNIDALKRADWTPLMIASTKGYVGVVKELVAHGAEVTRVNKDGWNSFHLACREGSVDVLAYLLSVNSTVWRNTSNNRRTPLHTACMHGRYEVVRFLVERCEYGKDEKDSCGTTPFMDALRFGHADIAQFLVAANKCDITAHDDLGRYPVHIAAHSGQLSSLRYIIDEHNVDVSSPCVDNTATPLHFAAKEGHVEVVEFLLLCGGCVNAVDKNGRTALHLAAAANRVDVVRLLLADVENIDAGVVDDKGMTAVEYALRQDVIHCFSVEK